MASSAAAQQDTNPPPAELQSGEAPVADQTDEVRIQFLLDVAAAYLGENDPLSAITAYERVIEIDPMNMKARYLSSTVYITAKQYAKAEQMLNTLIEENPEDFQLKNNLAWLYATAEDPAFRDGEKAIELAQEAMVLAPNVHNVWSTLAEAYYATGQYEKANQAITHMVSLARRYSPNMSEELIASYGEQVRKCRRSLDTEKALQPEEEEPLSVDEDAQEQKD
jgi:tetratricopeptide (TPR) repeat protein